MYFQYKAIKNEKVVVKRIEAESQQQVLTYLKENDYFPIEVVPSRNIIARLSNIFESTFNRLSQKDIIDFTRQLAIMLNAGLTLVNAIKILQKQTKKQNVLKMINVLDEQIRAGNSFSSSLKLFPHYFPNLYVALIRAGEASGKLNEILLKLAENMEKQHELNGKIKGSMVYPIIILMSMVGVIFVILTFVMPKLLGVYKDFGVELPLSTKILVALSSFFSTYWIFILMASAIAGFLLFRYSHSQRGKYFFDALLFKIPFLSNTFKMVSLIDNTRALALMVGAGVPILDGLTIIVETTDNLIYQHAYRNVLKNVEHGMSLGEALGVEAVFPPILVQMAIVGENTGHLDETLLRLSHYFEVESEIAIKALTTLIEPVTLIFLGFGVGVLVIAIITPIYNLTSSFNK